MNGMTLIVKTITRLVLGFIVIFAVSTVLYGHISPGGGFAGGVMMACAFILLVLAFGGKAATDIITEKGLTEWDTVGTFGFLDIALLGFFGGAFFLDIIPKGTPLKLISGGGVLWSNIAIGIKVFAGLFAAFMALAVFRMNREK